MSTMVTYRAKDLHPVRLILHEADLQPCTDGRQAMVEFGTGEGTVIVVPKCLHGKRAVIMTCDLVVPEVVK